MTCFDENDKEIQALLHEKHCKFCLSHKSLWYDQLTKPVEDHVKFGFPAKFIPIIHQLMALGEECCMMGNLLRHFQLLMVSNRAACLHDFTVMLNDAFEDSDAGISFKYKVDGKLFNLRRLLPK